MKDYYYILGLGKEATSSEIQQAYKKLSLKFHPEDNGNDPFFVMHFEKIKEAYLVLSDDHKRYRYDKALNAELSAEVDRILDGPKPVISSFFASKKASKKGELLTISWEVLNAEEVHINLIGDVATNGTQTIRLMEDVMDTEYLTLELVAKNSTSSEASKKEIKIKNLTYSIGSSHSITQSTISSDNNEITVTNKKKPRSTSKKTVSKQPKKKSYDQGVDYAQRRRGQGVAYVLVAVMFFMIVIMLYTLHTINPMF